MAGHSTYHVMAQSIPSVSILSWHLSENLCPGVGHLSILLEAVKAVPFSSLENIPISIQIAS